MRGTYKTGKGEKQDNAKRFSGADAGSWDNFRARQHKPDRDRHKICSGLRIKSIFGSAGREYGMADRRKRDTVTICYGVFYCKK